jgi:DNA-damage-inducible protein D
LEYSEYRHFKSVIEKAKLACINSGYDPDEHFEDILEMVSIGSGAAREIDNIKLSRYACYLIIESADPSKEIVALGHSYFALQTRKQELQDQSTKDKQRVYLRDEMKTHNKKLASTAQKA